MFLAMSLVFLQPERLCVALSGRLFDFQNGGVALHDGHDDFVNVVLESVVDLLLFVDGLHQLKQ